MNKLLVVQGSGFWAGGTRTPNPEPRTPNGFTLVELLVVIAILGILVSLVTAGAQAARRRAAVTKAKTTIAALETAIAAYSGDMGDYPPTGNGEMISALQDDPEEIGRAHV